MKPRKPDHVLDEIAQDHFSKIIDLAPTIRARAEKEKKTRMKSTKRIFIAVPAFVLVVALIFISVPGAARAMNRLLGYVSGVGLVDQTAPLRVLSEPVKSNQNGVSITVEQAVLDSEHTVVAISGRKPGRA